MCWIYVVNHFHCKAWWAIPDTLKQIMGYNIEDTSVPFFQAILLFHFVCGLDKFLEMEVNL